MFRASLILFWELFRQTWLAGVVAIAAMIFWGIFIPSNGYAPNNFLWFAAFATIVFLFVNSSREGLTFAFSQRQFTLPITIVSLLNILLVYRLCAISCVGAVLCGIQSKLYTGAPPLIVFLFILCLVTLWTQAFVCLLSVYGFWKALGGLVLSLGFVVGMSGVPDIYYERMFQQYSFTSPALQHSLYFCPLLFSLIFWFIAVKNMRATFPKNTANILSLFLLIMLLLGKVYVYTRLSSLPSTALVRLFVEYMAFSAHVRVLSLVKSAAVPLSLLLLAVPVGYIGALWALTQSRNRGAFHYSRRTPAIGWPSSLSERRRGQWSPLRAQIWYEWRQTYRWLPYLAIPSAIGLMAVFAKPRHSVVVIIGGICLIMAWGVGYFGLRRSVTYASSVFTKPVSIPTLCRAKLLAGLAGVIPVFVLLALAGASFCLMSPPEYRQVLMNQLALSVVLILLVMFGGLYLGRVALAYLSGFFLIAASIIEMLERSGYASEMHLYTVMALGLFIPLILGLWMVFWAWHRKALPCHHALLNLITVPGAVLVGGIMIFTEAIYGILWFNILVLMCIPFMLVWVPFVLYRQRHR